MIRRSSRRLEETALGIRLNLYLTGKHRKAQLRPSSVTNHGHGYQPNCGGAALRPKADRVAPQGVAVVAGIQSPLPG